MILNCAKCFATFTPRRPWHALCDTCMRREICQCGRAVHDGLSCGVPLPESDWGTAHATDVPSIAAAICTEAEGYRQRKANHTDACMRFNRIAELARKLRMGR